MNNYWESSTRKRKRKQVKTHTHTHSALRSHLCSQSQPQSQSQTKFKTMAIPSKIKAMDFYRSSHPTIFFYVFTRTSSFAVFYFFDSSLSVYVFCMHGYLHTAASQNEIYLYCFRVMNLLDRFLSLIHLLLLLRSYWSTMSIPSNRIFQ